MDSTLDDIAFLSNTANRIAVLDALVDGPHSRHVLMERIDVSRVTLGRILDDLEARRWISQRGQICDATALGAWVAEEFGAFRDRLAAERRLREVIEWFPEPGYGFHIGRLADAEITRVSPADASAPITRLVREFERGGRVRAFSFAITSQFLEACGSHVRAGTIDYDWVFTPEVLAVLRNDPAMARRSGEMLDSGRVSFSLHRGPIPYVVVLAEGRVNLRLADGDGAAMALVQTDDAVVRSWAESTFEDYRRAATPVEAAAFAA